MDKKKQRKQATASKKRKDKAAALMLETTQHISLYEMRSQTNSVWDYVLEARDFMLTANENDRIGYCAAMISWRFAELRIIIHMLNKEWMQLDPLNETNASTYVMLTESAYEFRLYLGKFFNDRKAVTTPKITDPDKCRQNVLAELKIISDASVPGDAHNITKQIGIATFEKWYIHLSFVLMSVLEVTIQNKMEIADCSTTQYGEHNFRQFEAVCMLSFLSFRKTSDFLTALGQWRQRNHAQHAHENSKFNYTEVSEYMNRKWDEALAEYINDETSV